MSVSDKLITEEIGQAISLLEGVLVRLHAMTNGVATFSMSEGTFVPTDTPSLQAVTELAEPKTTLEQVRAALTTLASAKGAAAPKGILANYGVKKLSELAPADFGAALMAAQFAMAAQTMPEGDFKAAQAEASGND